MDDSYEEGENWESVKILGSGGFGQVTLWHNKLTGQKVAVKKLLDTTLKDSVPGTKLIERWCNEVDIMKKLKHPNVIATLEPPPVLCTSSSLPVLAMEYCSSGDLRQVLNKAENCSGLPEKQIIDILRDVSSGLAYLHSSKIIHRDLKPDNIVLQEKGSATVYKLIDLGYAKTLDENSLSKSFVGTIQYIAPELFMGKEYTCSVDYWSLGLMAHEIITGYRPFLPGSRPSHWMKLIQNKDRKIVSVVEKSNGEFLFCSNISRKNHCSRCFLEDMEQWLRLALDWDGETRGRDAESKRVVIFESLAAIISKKLLKVFSMPTYEILSLEVNHGTDISELRRSLKERPGLFGEENGHILLLPNGKCLSMNGPLRESIDFEKLDRSTVSLFLYNSKSFFLKPGHAKPSPVREQITSNGFSRAQLKKFSARSVFFLQNQATLYRYFLQGIKVKIKHTQEKTLAMATLYKDIEDDWSRVECYAHYLSVSHKVDLESYILYRKAGKLKSSPYVQKWIRNVIYVNNKITELKKSFNKIQQRELVLLAKERCKNLDNQSGTHATHRTPLDNLVSKGQKLWETVLKTYKNDCDNTSAGNIVDLIEKTVEESEKFVKSDAFHGLFEKIWEADENLSKFLAHLTSVYKSINTLKIVIEHTQAERQREVWSLIDTACARGSGEENNLGRNATTDGNEENLPTLEVKSEITGEDFDFPESADGTTATSIIEDNNHLRYKIQEAQQSCSLLVNEISSLNWNCILD